VRQAEPAAAARWLYRAVAGDARAPALRILGAALVLVLVAVSVVALLASVLAVLSLLAVAIDRIAPAEATRGEPTISWPLVVTTTGVFLVIACAVSWSAIRREARVDEDRAAGSDHEGEAKRDPSIGT
jgi:hypothetical protein